MALICLSDKVSIHWERGGLPCSGRGFFLKSWCLERALSAFRVAAFPPGPC